MNSSRPPSWPSAPVQARVPQRYFGVWSRTLLETPDTRDSSSFVRWMQLGHWHVDLRIGPAADAPKQGFCGITRVTQRADGEVCTWLRLVDYSPPRATVDEGLMEFKTPQQVLETGIHSPYREVWDRLPGSTGRQIALAHADHNADRSADSQPTPPGGAPTAGMRLFVAGDFAMRVRPAQPLDPAFEISFGRLTDGIWQVEQSTLAALVGQRIALSFRQTAPQQARVQMDGGDSSWDILEWFNP